MQSGGQLDASFPVWTGVQSEHLRLGIKIQKDHIELYPASAFVVQEWSD